jgi:hypothetical protein
MRIEIENPIKVSKQTLIIVILAALLTGRCFAQDSVMVKYYRDGPYSFMFLWYPGETPSPCELYQDVEGPDCICLKDTLKRSVDGKFSGKNITIEDTVVFQPFYLCDTLLNRIRNSCKLSGHELAIRKKAAPIIGDNNKEFLRHLNNTKPRSKEITGYCLDKFDSLLVAWNQMNVWKIDSIKTAQNSRLHLITDAIIEPDSAFILSFLDNCNACTSDLLLLYILVDKFPDLLIQTLEKFPQNEIPFLIPDMSHVDQQVVRIIIRKFRKIKGHHRTKKLLVRHFKAMK